MTSTCWPAYAERSKATGSHWPDTPVKEFHAPLVPVGVHAPGVRVRYFSRFGWSGDEEPGSALGGHVGGGVAVAVGQRRPVLLPDGVGLDDDVVVAELDIPGQLGLERRGLRRRDRRQVERPRQAHVAVVVVEGGRRDVALDGDERPADVGVVGDPEARRELRELLGRQDVAERDERSGLVDRVVDGRRTAELGRRTGRRSARADDPTGADRHARRDAQVVLREVVGEQEAVAEEVGRDDAVLLGRAVQAVVDATERVAELPVVAGGLAGVDELAALVEEVAHRHRQVLLAFGDRQIGAAARTGTSP